MAPQLSGTLSNFIIRIRRHLGEETASKSFWSDDFIKQTFNVCYRLRCLDLVMAFEGNFVAIATRDLVAEQERYSWPTGFERLQRMELVRDDGRTVPVQRYERHYEIKNIPASSGDTYTPNFRPVESGFVLEPAPLANDDGALRIEYFGTPEELTANDDTFKSDFPTVLDELVVIDTAVICYDQEQMQETGQMRSLLRARAEIEMRFERWIENKIISMSQIAPFIPHYQDA